jgi:hypothetical protein
MIRIADLETESHPLDHLSRPLAEARFQAAIVRALLDELKHPDAPAQVKRQVAEELEILRDRIAKVADAIRETTARDSGEYLKWSDDLVEEARVSA